MPEMSDADSIFFAERRKMLNELLGDLEALSNVRPIVRRAMMTDIKMSILLHKLAFMVKQDNDIFETTSILDQRKHDRIDSMIILLAEEIRKIKGTDTSKLDAGLEGLRKEVADLQQYKPALKLMQELEPEPRDSVEKRKKWKKDNK